jgi:hypothetical protein
MSPNDWPLIEQQAMASVGEIPPVPEVLRRLQVLARYQRALRHLCRAAKEKAEAERAAGRAVTP